MARGLFFDLRGCKVEDVAKLASVGDAKGSLEFGSAACKELTGAILAPAVRFARVQLYSTVQWSLLLDKFNPTLIFEMTEKPFDYYLRLALYNTIIPVTVISQGLSIPSYCTVKCRDESPVASSIEWSGYDAHI